MSIKNQDPGGLQWSSLADFLFIEPNGFGPLPFFDGFTSV